MKKTFMMVFGIGMFGSLTFADRALNRPEILGILTQLTEAPNDRWISSGSMEAVHEEYRAARLTDASEITAQIAQAVQAYENSPNKIQKTEELQAMKLEAIPFNVRYELSNEYTMNSLVVVKVDGEKFYWQTTIISRRDSVTKPVELKTNFLTDEFDLTCNEESIFTWDGQKYITYFKPVNHAIITSERGGVNGPLTAGVIPWGYGRYSYENLSQTNLTALETETNGQRQVQLTAVGSDGAEETFILDADRDYALKHYSAHLANGQYILQTYNGYQQTAGRWCPAGILVEQYDMTQNPQRLIARDVWNITSISEQKPASADFGVSYDMDAFIEDFCFGPEPLQYRYSGPQTPSARNIDVDRLIEQRLEIAAASSPQNCATASLKYVCDNLGVECSLETLSDLVGGDEKNCTTLAQMKQFVESSGLHVRAGVINRENLKGLGDYQAIVHLPAAEHFTVLGAMDEHYARLIDLASNQFYVRLSVQDFDTIWTGTALLVGREPVEVKGDFTEIDAEQLNRIIGASTCQQCNTPCSGGGDSACQAPGGSCGGVHTIYYPRTCCGTATSGTCHESSLVYKKKEPCATDPNTLECAGIGEWTSYTMQACN